MRKVLLSVMLSLDGLFEGPEGGWDLAWHRADDAWDAYAVELLRGADTLLFGRETYAGFEQYWPSQPGELARALTVIEKVVFSTTLERVDWSGARIVRGGAAEEVARLKTLPGKDIVVFASADFAATLMAEGLVDEYLLAYNPVVLGAGRPFFHPGQPRLDLKLTGTRTFASGIVVLSYTPDPEAAR